MNRINTPIEIQELSDCIKQQDPAICCIQETYFRFKDTINLKVTGQKKTYHANCI